MKLTYIFLINLIQLSYIFSEVEFKFHYIDNPGTGFNAAENAWAREAVEKAGKTVGNSLQHKATINLKVIAVTDEGADASIMKGANFAGRFNGENFMQDIFHDVNDSKKLYGPILINFSKDWMERNGNINTEGAYSLVKTFIHELTHGLGFGSPGRGAYPGSNPLLPYIDNIHGQFFFKDFYTTNVSMDCGSSYNQQEVIEECAHVCPPPNGASIMEAISRPGQSLLSHWDKLTASILADIGYCLKTDFITTKDCLFTKRERFKCTGLAFQNGTDSPYPFKITLLHKTQPIFTYSLEYQSGWEFPLGEKDLRIEESSFKHLALSIEWGGFEYRIPLRAGIYPLTNANSLQKCSPNCNGHTYIKVEEDDKYTTVRFLEEKFLFNCGEAFIREKESMNLISVFPPSLKNENIALTRNVYAYRQIIRVDHDVVFSVVIKDDEYIYFQEMVQESDLNKKYSIKANAHLIGSANPQSKVLLKLNDKSVVAEFSLLPGIQQTQEVTTAPNGKQYKIDFQVVDKYQESNIPEYFLLLDIKPVD